MAFLAGVFFAAALDAVLAAAFFGAAVFFAALFEALFFFGAGPFARFSASSSIARSSVSSSIVVPRGTVMFVSPSVMYGPKRPSLTVIGLPDTGSAPNSRSGGFAVPRPPRVFGCA